MDLQRVQASMMSKRAMDKQAVVTNLIKSIGGPAAAAGAGAHNAALYLIGAAAIAGGVIGAFGAQLTAHGKQDEDTVKKEYENERLKADVGYLSSRLEDEFNRSKMNNKPKAARVLNV